MWEDADENAVDLTHPHILSGVFAPQMQYANLLRGRARRSRKAARGVNAVESMFGDD